MKNTPQSVRKVPAEADGSIGRRGGSEQKKDTTKRSSLLGGAKSELHNSVWGFWALETGDADVAVPCLVLDAGRRAGEPLGAAAWVVSWGQAERAEWWCLAAGGRWRGGAWC